MHGVYNTNTAYCSFNTNCIVWFIDSMSSYALWLLGKSVSDSVVLYQA
jgi:hypothetical protein